MNEVDNTTISVNDSIKDAAKRESKAINLCEKLLKYKKSIAYTSVRGGFGKETKHMSAVFKSRKIITEILSTDKSLNDMAMEMLVHRVVTKTYCKYDISNYDWKPSSDGKGFILSADIENFERYY